MDKMLINMNKKAPAPSDGTDVVLRRKELGTNEAGAEVACKLCPARRRNSRRENMGGKDREAG